MSTSTAVTVPVQIKLDDGSSSDIKTVGTYYGASKLNNRDGFEAHSYAGHTLIGYYSQATGGVMVLTKEGNFAINSGSEIKDEEVRYITANGQWGTKQPQTLYAHWEVITTTLTLKASQADDTTDVTVIATNGSNLPTFTPHTRASFTLKGYYLENEGGGTETKIINTDGSLVANTTYTDDSGKWTSDLATLELFAHWEADSTPVGPGGITDDSKEGAEITIAEQTWGVLREFYGGTYESTIDSPDVDATKKLIIKYGDIYQKTSEDPNFSTQYFYDSNGEHSVTQYFVSEDDTGYDSSFVKKEMDRYYSETIATTDIAPYIMPVNLDLPTFTRFTTEAVTLFDQRNATNLATNPPLIISSPSDVSKWYWNAELSWFIPNNSTAQWDLYGYLDTRFKTLLTGNKAGSLTDKKQAFALSYGDLNSLPLDKSNGQWGKKAVLVNCKAQFYLRSPLGSDQRNQWGGYERVGAVVGTTGTFRNDYRELQQIDGNGKAAIVPALWISTRPIHNVTLDLNGATSGSTALTVTEGSKFIYGLENTDEMPKKDGSTFAGYFTSAESGEQVIDDKGKLVTAETAYTKDGKWTSQAENITLHAHWTADVQTAKKTAKLSR